MPKRREDWRTCCLLFVSNAVEKLPITCDGILQGKYHDLYNKYCKSKLLGAVCPDDCHLYREDGWKDMNLSEELSNFLVGSFLE